MRHNLSLNKCFEKVENKMSGSSRKGCLWALNLARIDKMEEEMHKWKRKDLAAIHRSMANPGEARAPLHTHTHTHTHPHTHTHTHRCLRPAHPTTSSATSAGMRTPKHHAPFSPVKYTSPPHSYLVAGQLKGLVRNT